MLDRAEYGGTFFSHGWQTHQLIGPQKANPMQVAINEVRWVEVDKKARQRLARCEAEKLCTCCLEPLGDEQPIRGQHPRCYKGTMRAIAARTATEAERVAKGMMLERKPAGRKPSNPGVLGGTAC